MTVDELMEYRRAKPFKPFVLQLKDGREFLIREPEHISRNDAFTRVSFAADEESFETVNIDAVAGVKPARGRGADPRRRRAS
jgi:hypothetical protein